MSGCWSRMWTSATSVRRRRVASPSRRCSARTAAASGVPIRSSTPGIARRTARSRRGSARASEAGRRAASPAATRAAEASSASGGRPSASRRDLANGAAPCRAAARMAVRATSSSSSSTSRRSASSNGRGSLSARRAASRRVRRPRAPSSADHRLEERLRRLEALLAQAGEHRHHRRADREVGEVAEVPQPRERVHVGVAREVEERLGPDLEVGIVQQRLHPRQDRPVARLVQDPEGATAHLGVRVLEQAAHRGVGRGRVAADGHHVEGVQDLLRVHSLEPGGEHLGRLPVEHLRRGAIGVEAVLLQALAQRGHVATVRPRGQDAATGR